MLFLIFLFFSFVDKIKRKMMKMDEAQNGELKIHTQKFKNM